MQRHQVIAKTHCSLSPVTLFSTYDYMYTASISIAMLVLLQLLIWKTEAVLM